MSGNSSDPKAKETWMRALRDGWRKRFPRSPRNLLVLGKLMTKREIGDHFDETLAACERVTQLRLQFSEAVAKRNTLLAQLDPFATAVEGIARGAHANDLAALKDYGLTPPKKGVMTVEDKAIANERRLATREVRQVMGRRQRKAITLQPQPTLKVLGPDGRPLRESLVAAAEAQQDQRSEVTVTPIPPGAPHEPARLPAASDPVDTEALEANDGPDQG